MATWGDLLAELAGGEEGTPPPIDNVRRRQLVELHELTGRPVVAYYSGWLSRTSQQVAVQLGDMQGLMEVFRDIPGPGLDLVLHSPGGDPTAAASLVGYMRSKYSDVRVFVPLAAMSAATMWAMAADRVVMGKHSQVGPIDPQLVMPQGNVPAGAIIRQFREAQAECAADPGKLSAWLPTLQQYYPGLLELCANAEELGRSLVAEWLEAYMFKDDVDGSIKAQAVAQFLADDQVHRAHSRPVVRQQLRALGVVIDDLEDDAQLQDAVLGVHHAYMHTFAMTPTVKIVENHLGRAYITQEQQQAIQFAMPQMTVLPAG